MLRQKHVDRVGEISTNIGVTTVERGLSRYHSGNRNNFRIVGAREEILVLDDGLTFFRVHSRFSLVSPNCLVMTTRCNM